MGSKDKAETKPIMDCIISLFGCQGEAEYAQETSTGGIIAVCERHTTTDSEAKEIPESLKN